MSTIGNVSLLAPSATTSSSNSSQTLTQQDFLKIMVAQFTQQDPLSSGDGSSSGSGTSDYVNQLMSMTNLTTMQTMSGEQGLQLAGSLPGATVDLSVNGADVNGVVQKTTITSSGINLTIDGQDYPSSDLISVDQTAAQAAAIAAAGTTTASQH